VATGDSGCEAYTAIARGVGCLDDAFLLAALFVPDFFSSDKCFMQYFYTLIELLRCVIEPQTGRTYLRAYGATVGRLCGSNLEKDRGKGSVTTKPLTFIEFVSIHSTQKFH
jgi:hypothetical protein